MANERWLTVRQVADYLQVHPESVRRMLRQGRLPGKRLSIQAGWRVSASELDTFLRPPTSTKKGA